MKSTSVASMLAGIALCATLAVPAMAQEKKGDTHLQAAVEVVKQAGTLPSYGEHLNAVLLNAKNWLIRENPALQKEIIAAIEEVSKDYLKKGEARNIAIGEVWASYFKEDELKEILAFFKTDVGQKLATYQPRIIGESLKSFQKFNADFTAEIVRKAKVKLNEKGHKFK